MDNEPKRGLLALLQGAAVPAGHWALRGGETGLAKWLETEGGKDIDLWVGSEALEAFCASLSHASVGVVSLENDPRWLRHVVFVMPGEYAGQLVDISFGDLKVGATLTCREALVTTGVGPFGPQLTGVAAVSDLLLRKLLRGKAPNDNRLQEARRHWQAASDEQREAWLRDLDDTIGSRLVGRVLSHLGGSMVTRRDCFDFSLAAIRSSWRFGGPGLLWRRRRRMVLGRRQRTLLKRPVASVLLHLCGKWEEDRTINLVATLKNLGATVQYLKVPPRRSLLGRCSLAMNLIRCWLLGKVVILADESDSSFNRSVAARGTDTLFGAAGTIRLRKAGTSAEPAINEKEFVEQYYLAAHRWYIDEPGLAQRLCKHESYKSQGTLVVEG